MKNKPKIIIIALNYLNYCNFNNKIKYLFKYTIRHRGYLDIDNVLVAHRFFLQYGHHQGLLASNSSLYNKLKKLIFKNNNNKL